MKKLNYYDLSLIVLILVVGWLVYKINVLQEKFNAKEKEASSMRNQLDRADSTFSDLVDSLRMYRGRR